MNKFLLSSLMAAAAAMPAVAGVDNINYQAVIKDADGIVKDTKVDLKFELLDDQTVVYTEEQAPTTNASGLVVCQLGGDDALTDLNWGNLTLKVSVNLGHGYQVISNEPISSVPTALYALKSADSEMIIDEVQTLILENETTKETILGINAELVKLNGVADDVEDLKQSFENLGENLDNSFSQMQAQFDEVNGQIENLNQVAAVTRANEEGLENVEKDFANLGENLDNAFSQMQAQFDEVNGQLENLNQVAAVVRANEEAIETLQGDFNNLGENLDNSFSQMTAKFDEVEGQLENLNQVAAVTRANEEAVEELNTSVEAAFERLQNIIDKMQRQIDSLEAEIATLKGE